MRQLPRFGLLFEKPLSSVLPFALEYPPKFSFPALTRPQADMRVRASPAPPQSPATGPSVDAESLETAQCMRHRSVRQHELFPIVVFQLIRPGRLRPSLQNIQLVVDSYSAGCISGCMQSRDTFPRMARVADSRTSRRSATRAQKR